MRCWRTSICCEWLFRRYQSWQWLIAWIGSLPPNLNQICQSLSQWSLGKRQEFRLDRSCIHHRTHTQTHTSATDAHGKCKGSSQPEVCDVHGFGLREETKSNKQTEKNWKEKRNIFNDNENEFIWQILSIQSQEFELNLFVLSPVLKRKFKMFP